MAKSKKMTDTKNTKIPIKIKIGYGAAEGANSLVFTLFYTFAMFFLTDVVKLDPAFAGTIMAIGILWNGFVDPAVGIWSDNIKGKWGRRRPFFLAIAVPFGLIIWFLFTNFDLSPGLAKIYFSIVVILYFTFYTLLETPHLALSAEMTQDYDERTSLVGWRIGWSQFGSIIGGAAPLLMVAYYADKFSGQNAGWSMMAGTVGLLCIPLILITWRSTKGYELFPEDTSIKIKDLFTGPMMNRSFRFLVVGYTFALIAMTVNGGVGMYFMTYVLELNETQISTVLFVAFGVAMLWIPVIDFIAKKLGKRYAWFIFVGVWMLITGVFMQFIIQPGQVMLMYILAFFLGSGLTTIYMIGWAMIPDCVEVDEFKTGQRREGLYFGFIAFVQKGACALAMQITGMALSWVGYVPDTQQTETALNGIRSIYGLGQVFFLMISIILIALMPMTKKKHEAVCKAIELKKAGKEYDVKPFADLI